MFLSYEKGVLRVVRLNAVGLNLFLLFDLSPIAIAFYSSIAISTALLSVKGALALVNTFTFEVNELIYLVKDIFSINAAGVLIPFYMNVSLLLYEEICTGFSCKGCLIALQEILEE